MGRDAGDNTSQRHTGESRAALTPLLLSANEQLNSLLATVPVGIGVMDRDGAMIACNAEMQIYLPAGVLPSRDPRTHLWRAFHPDGSPVPQSDFPCAKALRGIARTDLDMLHTDENGREIWARFSAVPIRDGSGDVTGAVATVTNIDALKRSDLALHESELRFAAQIAQTQALQNQGDRLALLHDLQSLYQMIVDGAASLMRADAATIQEYDPETETLTLLAWRGIHPKSAPYWKRLGPEASSVCGMAARERRRVSIADVLVELDADEEGLNAFRVSGIRAVQSTPLVTPGSFVGMLSTQWSEAHDPKDHDYRAFDIFARWAATLIESAQSEAALRASEAHQKVLVSELQHRTRNLIAVVQALANDGIGSARSLEEFNDVFGQRLATLSRVQGMLSHPDPATIGELVEMELDAVLAGTMQDRIRLSGPKVELRLSMIQTVAIALHELATNALKHGSIGRGGTLDVTWRLMSGEPDRLVLEWREEGPEFSPEQRSAARPGYGRELIERALPYSLGARTSFELLPSGVFCVVDLPLGRPERRPL